MALNQAVHLMPGLAALVARVERPPEPGQARQYWDGAAAAWAPLAAGGPVGGVALGPHVPVVPDPDLPGLYLVQVPTAQTASWPDGLYRVTLINAAIDGPDRVASGPFDVCVLRGDDGYQGVPSVTIPWLGCTITLWGARSNTPSRT